MPEALLLSGSLGMGHDVMAEACAVSLRRRDWTTDTLNSLEMMGNSQGALGERVFRNVLSIPGAYDAFHFTALRSGNRLARFAERASNRFAVPALDAHLSQHPVDLVVSVFATGAAAVSQIKSKHRGLKTAVFCTDINPHSMWVQDNTDVFLVTSQVSAAFVRRFAPAADVVVVPPPVRPQFYDAPSQLDARDQLGIPADAACVLLMAGSWGIGPLAAVAAAIARAGIHVIAVAGNNKSLHESLDRLAQQQPKVLPYGYTDEIPLLMAASDIVITSSGDTCSEARTIGRHLLLLDVVPGHGRENLQEELARGDADVASTDSALLVRAVESALARMTPPAAAVARTIEGWEAAFGAALDRLGFAGSS